MHKVVSFYKDDLPAELIEAQKKVFEYFNIKLQQVSFSGFYTELPHKGLIDNDCHAHAIERYLINNNDWDSITLFDVDCVPFESNCIVRALDIIKDRNTIYGNAQASNTGEHNLYTSPPFAAPSFLSFTRNIWEDYKEYWYTNLKKEIGAFTFQWYPNPDGNMTEADVAEVFTRENEKRGRKIVMAYPSKDSPYDNSWTYKGGFGYPAFSYGNCNEFTSGTCHNFQIRIPDKQRYFIDYCNNILNK